MKLVQVYLNTKYIEVVPYLIAHGAIPNFDVPPIYLSPEVDNESLGKSINDALKQSKNISPSSLFKIISSGALENNAKHLEEKLIKDFSYRNKKELYKHIRGVSIEILNEEFHISSLHVNNNGEFSGIDGLPSILLPIQTSNEILGGNTRLAFEACTNT